jgi:glyoxylate reductase
MHKVLYTGCTFSPDRIKELGKQGLEVVPTKPDLKEEELMAALQGYEIYILGGDEIATKKVIDSTDRLKLIAFLGTGYEKYIDTNAAKEKGIAVTNTPGANAVTVAELSIGLILDLVKKISFQNNDVKRGGWNKKLVWNLEGKIVGVVGMGKIGGIVAKILHDGFGMNVIYYNRTSRPEIEKALNASKTSLDELCRISDVITIHIAYAKETVGMIAKAQFDLMKPQAVLVNTARAEIIDGMALRIALEAGKIAGAAMDGYYQEPPMKLEEDSFGLRKFADDKIIFTPHNGFNSSDAIVGMENMLLQSIEDLIAGREIKYRVV